jgi:hypothetical protein
VIHKAKQLKKWGMRVWEKFICFSVSLFEHGNELFTSLKMQLNIEIGVATIRSTINIILFGVPRYEGNDRGLLNGKVFPVAEGYLPWDGQRSASKCLNLLTV